MLLDRYQQLKRKYEISQRNLDRSIGALQSLEKQLLTDFECDRLELAEMLLVQLQEQEVLVEKKFKEALERFEKRHGEFLK